MMPWEHVLFHGSRRWDITIKERKHKDDWERLTSHSMTWAPVEVHPVELEGAVTLIAAAAVANAIVKRVE